MRVKSNKLALRVLSTATFLAMVSSCATAAFAGTYYMEDGSISIVAKTDGNYITQGTTINDQKDAGETVITNHDSETASKNTVTIKAEEDCTANVTLDNVNIDASDTGKAAIHTEGNVTLELDGDNTLTGGEGHAALEKYSSSDKDYTLTLQDETTGDGKTGSLTANGGAGGAGIGGGKGDGSIQSGQGFDITIKDGAHVEATGDKGGAGIGGGDGSAGGYGSGLGRDITIAGEGTTVTASGDAGGAGIGGGKGGTGSLSGLGNNITIQDGAHVKATGSGGGAGIGGGDSPTGGDGSGMGSNITITGEGTTVTSTGGVTGSGIGGGQNGQGYRIDISGGVQVEATGGAEGGAGIGGGKKTGTDANAGSGNTITISGETTQVTATGSAGGAGIGGGSGGYGAKITVNDGTVTASGDAGGAGIGGGNGGYGANKITVNDGTVTATGSAGGAGIGGGNGGLAQLLTITGGEVTANGGGGGAGTADSAGVTITNGTVTANGGAGAAGIGDGANNVSDVGSVISITGGTVTANGGAGEAAGIGNGENDANDAAVNISATTARLDVTAVTQGSDEAITGGDDMTMAELNNQFSGVVRFFRGTNHYNTVHNGKYVGMADNNADEHQETDAHIWGSTEIIRQATPTEQGIVRHHCAVDGCKGYYEEFFDYVAPAEPVTPAPTDPDTPNVPGTSDSTPGTPAQGTPADAAAADAVPGAATAEEVSVTPSGAQTVTAAALPKTGVNWLAAVGSAISGMVLLAAGYVLDRKSRRQN